MIGAARSAQIWLVLTHIHYAQNLRQCALWLEQCPLIIFVAYPRRYELAPLQRVPPRYFRPFSKSPI